MTEENKALTNVEEIKNQIIELDSESEKSMNNDYIPIIKVSNDKVEIDVNGKKKKVLCDPEFKITEKEGEEYKDSPYAKDFEGVILSINYYVCSKWEEKPINPYFKSQEFDNWNTPIVLRSDKELSRPMSYKEFKEIYNEKYSLVMILYVLIDEQVRKIKITGSSRGTVWDHLGIIDRKAGDSITLHITKFSAETEETDSGFEFNKLKLEDVADKAPDFDKVLEYKREIKDALHKYQENIMNKANNTNPALNTEVVSDKETLPDMK